MWKPDPIPATALGAGREPDAKTYYCANCGSRAVYGCEELVLMQEANEI